MFGRVGNSNAEEGSSLVRNGKWVVATVKVKRSAPGLPHAQHIHGTGRNQCPNLSRTRTTTV